MNRAAGAPRATVDLVLGCGDEELHLSWTDDSTPGCTATLREGIAVRAVSVADPDWASALLAYGPVFSYAQTQDRLGTEADLRGYLENPLALGPCFAQLKADVEVHATESKTAADALTDLKRHAKREVEAVDARYSAESGAEPKAVGWPRFWTSDPDDWFTRLAATAERLAGWDAARRRLATAARPLLDLARDEIRPLLAAAGGFGLATADLDAVLHRLLPGSAPAVEQRGALEDLSSALIDPGFAELVEQVHPRCDRTRRWRRCRRDAVEQMVHEWRRIGSLAAERTAWSEADKKVTRLRNDLRDGRSTPLADEVRDVFARLLPDADLQLSPVSLRKSGDSNPIRMTDGDGRELRLGTLSAGQRNALILAPLLRLPAAGPFGFLLVDDPVHAFDELRVDLLADELVRLAEHRRVVVMTHDGRLQEMLTARFPDTELRTLHRVGGAVTETARSRPWESLLDDADSVVRLSDEATIPAVLGRLTGLVRGTCRHAVDGAIRQLALRWSVLAGTPADPTLQLMDDKAVTTKDRLAWAERSQVPGAPSPAAEALRECRTYLGGWNDAAHHDDAEEPVSGLRGELAAARRTCEVLTSWGRP